MWSYMGIVYTYEAWSFLNGATKFLLTSIKSWQRTHLILFTLLAGWLAGWMTINHAVYCMWSPSATFRTYHRGHLIRLAKHIKYHINTAKLCRSVYTSPSYTSPNIDDKGQKIRKIRKIHTLLIFHWIFILLHENGGTMWFLFVSAFIMFAAIYIKNFWFFKSICREQHKYTYIQKTWR